MKLLKPSWVNHNGKPIFSVDIHPDGTKFATGGQGEDSGKVVIWNMAPVLREEDEKNANIPKLLCQMDNHLACVNCVRWSNNGLYLASGGDDKLVMVWKRAAFFSSLSCLHACDPVFSLFSFSLVSIQCGGTTHVLRLSWSPDGQYLVSAHAMNNSGPTAQIIERDGWKTNMDFVGHRKAVTVVKFNPKIFKKKQKNGSTPKPSCPYCCCAVGSKDRSLSVWLTSLKRPLVVIHDLFDKSIMDITWTLNGLGLLVCSMDGTVAFLDFSQDELGDPLNEEEKNAIHQNIYGKSLAITMESHLSSTIIENPEMLKYQQERQGNQNPNGAQGCSHENQTAKLTNVLNGESLEDIRKNLLKKQVETRTADGRRRITPLCIAQLDTGDFSPALFNSVPILPGSSASTQLTPQISSDSSTANSLGLRPSHDPTTTSPNKTAEENKDSGPAAVNSIGMKSNLLLTSASKIEPMKALDSRFTERSKATPGVTSVPLTIGITPLDRVKDSSSVKEPKGKDETSSDSEDKGMVKSLSMAKRKGEMEGAEVVEKRKKGRPRKDAKMMMPFPQTPVSAEKEPSRLTTPVAVLKLPTPSIQKSFSTQVSTDAITYLEVENEVSVVSGARLSQLKWSREGREWDMLLTSPHNACTNSNLFFHSDVVAVACEDRTLSVFTTCGRRLIPSIILSTPMSALHCSGHFVMALMASATLSVWDVQKQTVLVKNESLNPILSGTDATVSQSFLTQQGVPVVSLSNGKTYCFNSSLETWNLIADKQDSLVQCADFRNCLTSQDALGSMGPLALTQSRNLSAGRLASRFSSTPHHLQQGMTLAFLENQLSSALILLSASEYRHWLLIYARFLVNEGYEQRLRELCQDLLGPVHKSSSSSWEPTVLGLRKRDLLTEVMPVIGQNLRFQRLFTEYQDQLELLRLK
uniref:Protein HIRA n=1 Tax=Sinocyclocheilus grahami TaxID=75366 RepID=A0A672S431_SINGR